MKQHFSLVQSKLKPVSNSGDGFINKVDTEVEKVYLYTGSASLEKAGPIAVGLLCDGELRVSNTAQVYVSHPLQEIQTVEMIACQWVFENRPSDDSVEVLSWLESLGLEDYEARRIHDLFIRFCVYSLFNGIELKFEPTLKVVD